MFHYIKNGDTLARLAQEIGLENPVYLKEYNNTQCLPPDRITEELEPGKRLLIPKLTEIEQYNARRDAPFWLPEANPVLEWKAEQLNRTYQVKVRNNIEGQDKGSFQYRVQLQWLRSDHGYQQYSWSRSHYRFGKETKISQLASACSEAINPLLITLNQKGGLQQIGIDTQVLGRWPEIKTALSDAFPDSYAAAYIEDLGYVLFQQHLVDRRMRQDPFIKTFFAPIRATFNKGFSFFSLNLAPDGMPVRIQQEVATLDYTDSIPLLQSLAGTTFGDDQANLFYEGKYILSRKDGSIWSANVHTRALSGDIQKESFIELEAE
ncbi:hypothetical protein DBR32_14155 [Taibaiella sp. KBW10]|uniref:LysM peptidoglycan-binding domain-containing protein n=1 Tax=Taibaiella sp. KBW10 TaxID=2153357 RepID=UPI000F5B0938|nr:LysM peptidoglycan-binding domain-containing protein [Taibaiella sp. KBW10]RQO29726.1 hypothetical protein DBR32_14155 [Taibaiella sp. KBW10]